MNFKIPSDWQWKVIVVSKVKGKNLAKRKVSETKTAHLYDIHKKAGKRKEEIKRQLMG